MLKTAIMSMRAVVVMVRVIRGQGLLAIMTDDLSSHIQEAEALLLQCCHNTKQAATLMVDRDAFGCVKYCPKHFRSVTLQ